jgi:hypothetical protein
MYNYRPNLYIGFHGCDESVRDSLVMQPNTVKISEKPFDWLGHGFYVWENNYERALKWAKDKQIQGKIKKASVVGVVYLLGNCLDFTDAKFIDAIQEYYESLKKDIEMVGKNLPINKDANDDEFKDKLIRELDCLVIQHMHEQIENAIKLDVLENGYSELEHFDSSRGLFTEGGPAFPGAGIRKRNHIQICIRNKNCIKAFFIPRKESSFS